MIKLGAKALRTTKSTEKERSALQKNPIYIICDNVIDTYNIGSIFRLADAVAAEKVYLCGVSETPPNTRIKKASINTTEWVAWEYFEKTEEAVKDLIQKFSKIPPVILGRSKATTPESLRDAGQASMTSCIQVIAIEQDKRSISFEKAEY